jgi:hypothetical protein
MEFECDEHRLRCSPGQGPVAITGQGFNRQVLRQVRDRRVMVEPRRRERQFIVVRPRPDPDADTAFEETRVGCVRLRDMDLNLVLAHAGIATDHAQNQHQSALRVLLDRRFAPGLIKKAPPRLAADGAQVHG